MQHIHIYHNKAKVIISPLFICLGLNRNISVIMNCYYYNNNNCYKLLFAGLLQNYKL